MFDDLPVCSKLGKKRLALMGNNGDAVKMIGKRNPAFSQLIRIIHSQSLWVKYKRSSGFIPRRFYIASFILKREVNPLKERDVKSLLRVYICKAQGVNLGL